MAEDYRDPLAAAHLRIAELERENDSLKRASSARAASAGEVEALRLEQDLMRMDLAWSAAHRDLPDPERATASLMIARSVLIVSAVLIMVVPLLVSSAIPALWFILTASTLLFLAGYSRSVHRRRLQAWEAYQAQRREIERAAAYARSGSDVPLARPRLQAVAPTHPSDELAVDEIDGAHDEQRVRRLRRED